MPYHHIYRNDAYPRLTGGTGKWRERVTRSKARMISRMSGLPPKARILEVGCDHAVMLRMLEKAGHEMHGVDVNEDAVRLANHPRVRYGNADAIPHQGNTFDVCIASHVIEHLEEPHRLVIEAHRVLKPGGKLILIYPWELFRGMTIIPDVIFRGKPWRLLKEIHRHIFYPKNIQAMARISAFSHVRSKLFWGFPFIFPQFITVLQKN